MASRASVPSTRVIAGSTLGDGRYAVTRLLGQGSQGQTLEAIDKLNGQLVAIKRFSIRGAASWKDVELAEREARVLAQLDHPALPKHLAQFEEDGALLLVEHTYRQRWGVPGGLLERREDPRDAARREVFEETGLQIELLGEPAVVVDAAPQRVDLVFRARLVPGAPTEPTGSSPEIESVRWWPVDALPELQHETAHAMVALARSSRAPQARPLAPEDRESFAS